jgi:hypothetical protein
LDAIRKAGLDDVRFAWMGGLEPGQGHYYRIQGKSFLIEYDNTQNRATTSTRSGATCVATSVRTR